MIDTALTTLIGQAGLVVGRVTPAGNSKPVTRDLPRVAYTLISSPRRYTDSGVMQLRQARYQIDVFAEQRTDARAVIARITARANEPDAERRGLDGFKGTVDQTRILRIYFDAERDAQAAQASGQNTTIARCVVDLIVEYRELPPQPITP